VLDSGSTSPHFASNSLASLRSRTRFASAGMFFSSVIKAALRISRHTTSGEKYE
jgi:hypothetical protein